MKYEKSGNINIPKKSYKLFRQIILICVTLIITFLSVSITSNVNKNNHTTGIDIKTEYQTIKIGVLAKRGAERCQEKWGPTADYLTENIPEYFFEIEPLIYDEINTVVEKGEVDFIFTNPAIYVEQEYLYRTSRMTTLNNLRMGEECAVYGGVIFCRTERKDLRNLKDLKGKTFMAVEETSFGGWQTAWRELKKHGIDPHEDFASLSYGGTHDAVIYAVRDGKVDAGSVRTDVFEQMVEEKNVRFEDFHVFLHEHSHRFACEFPFAHSTDTYPEWSFAKVKHTSEKLAKEVSIALLEMSPDDSAAKAARCVGWTIPQQYQSVRECLKYLRLGQYKDYGKVTFQAALKQYWSQLVCGFVVVIMIILYTIRTVRLNRRLKKSEAKVRAIFSQTFQFMGILELDGTLLEANQTALEFAGIEEKDVLGKLFWETIWWTHSAELQDKLRDAVKKAASGQFMRFEASHPAHDGALHHIDFSLKLAKDESGKKGYLIAEGHDITDRKRAEEALFESESMYRSSIENASGVPYRLDRASNKYYFIGAGIKDLVGVAQEEFSPRAYNEMIMEQVVMDPDGLEDHVAYGEAFWRGEVAQFKADIRIQTSSGNVKWISDCAVPIRDDSDQVVGSLGILLDITKRKQIEKQLQESEARFRNLSEMLPEVIFETDMEMNLTYVNQRAFDLFGYSNEDFEKGLNGLEMLVTEDRDRAKANITKRLKGEVSGIAEYQALKIDGSTFPILFHASSIIKEGEFFGLRGVIVDITERKQAQELLQRRVFQQAEIAKFGESAISSLSLDELFGRAVALVSRVLGTKYAKVLEHRPEQGVLFLQAGVGWKEGWVGHKSVPDGPGSQGGYTLLQAEPVIAEDIYNDTRFSPPALLTEHNAVGGMTVAIPGPKRPFGVLGVHTDRMQRFSPDDAHFLEAIANILAAAIQQRQAEEALRENEEQFRTLMEQSPFAIQIHNPDGVMIQANKAWAMLWNVPNPEDMIGKYNVLEDPQACELGFDKFIQRALKGETVTVPEMDYDPKVSGHQGRKRTITSLIYPLRDKDNKIKNFVMTHEDITEQKRTEEANAQLSRAIEQADETIVITDAKGAIQYVNPAFEKTTGYMVKEAIGRNPRILKSGRHDDAFYKRMWETLSSGHEWSGEIINKKKDGTLFTENAVISPVFDSQGEIVNYVAAKNDITETKRLQALESRAERLETAGTIAGQVAHDFNNLLAPLIAYPDFIRDELPKNHPSLQYLDQMEKAAEKIANINQDLLAMGRRGHYNHDILNLNTVVQQAVMELEPLPKTLACEQDLCEDLMDILGGGAQLHRVISNILHNAQDAMQNIGQITIRTENYYVDDVSVVYSRVPKGEYVKLTISDTGCGIPEDMVQKIFDPFFTSKTTDKKRGSGLGMSVVDAVIKDHNGYIDLSTKIGEGTSFYIYFPITRKPKNEQQTIDIYGGSESVLIVDDDDVQRHVSAQILKKLGYQITSIDKGEKAVKLIKEKSFDLLVLDMIMPDGIDGTETYKRILEIQPDQKAIVVSGFSESERVIEAQKLGVGSFVQKPLTKEAIASAVRNELDRKKEIAVS